MLKMAGNSVERRESLTVYNYLCHKIGSKEVMKIRRLTFAINDIGKSCQFITSGSKGEGLDLKGSDLDVMHVDPCFKVYQSENDVVFKSNQVPLIMNTEETQPCFVQLCVQNYIHVLLSGYGNPTILNMLQKTHMGRVLSSQLYKLLYMSSMFSPSMHKVHGPCISDIDETHDNAWCLKCDKWTFQAISWVSRPRKTWPSSELVSRIISYGVLFVPIGCKGSRNENIEWRISFSVAEKHLIFSFSHTQILCYAMLKILLKEIVEKHEDVKGLLCSYFLKTLLFWISEETDPYVWRPNNIIPCFMACIQRLLYCVRYSILSHYFIHDNNLFYLRFNTFTKQKLTTILTNSYVQGINCLATSETFQHYQRGSHQDNESLISRHISFLHHLIPTVASIRIHHIGCTTDRFSKQLYSFLHHSKSGLSKGLFPLQLSAAFMHAPEATTYIYSSRNKYCYFRYKHDLSNLTIGLHSDAVSGLLKLASFFYVHENYIASLTVITHTLTKCTKEKIYTAFFHFTNTFTNIQNHAVNMLKREKIYTIFKLLTIHNFRFNRMSSIVPQELEIDASIGSAIFHPWSFAHFLRFLCYYHLGDMTSCIQCLHQLQQIQWIITECRTIISCPDTLNTDIFCGIAYQLIGETKLAEKIFKFAARCDKFNQTSAAARLSSLI